MRRSLVAAALMASSVVLASCAMPADDPNWDPNATEGGVLEEDPEVAAAAAAVEATYEDYLVAPTSIGVDTPLTAPPAAGLALLSLTDGSEYEAVFETALAEAAGVVGWTVESVPVDYADPASLTTALNDAIAAAPAGIHINGALAAAIPEDLAAAEAAGVPIVCTGCSADTAGVTDASINGTEQNDAWGDVLATYVATSQYEGEDAGVQIFTLPGGATADFALRFNTSLIDQCRNCSATESTVDPTYTDLTDQVAVNEFVVSEMSTSLGAWGLLTSGSLSAGTADALANDFTLLSPVTVIGRGATAANIEALKAIGPVAAVDPAADDPGTATDAVAEADMADEDLALLGRSPEEAAALQAWIGLPQPVMAWRVVDQFARILGGQEVAAGPLPSQLLTGTTVADAALDEQGNYIGIADYQDQFKALWGVQ